MTEAVVQNNENGLVVSAFGQRYPHLDGIARRVIHFLHWYDDKDASTETPVGTAFETVYGLAQHFDAVLHGTSLHSKLSWFPWAEKTISAGKKRYELDGLTGLVSAPRYTKLHTALTAVDKLRGEDGVIPLVDGLVAAYAQGHPTEFDKSKVGTQSLTELVALIGKARGWFGDVDEETFEEALETISEARDHGDGTRDEPKELKYKLDAVVARSPFVTGRVEHAPLDRNVAGFENSGIVYTHSLENGLRLRVVALTDVDQNRKNNEDYFAGKGGLVAVSDGVDESNIQSAHSGGVASSVAVHALLEAKDQQAGASTLLNVHFHGVQERIAAYIKQNKEFHGMGCTLSALHFLGTDVELAHIGNSRVYRLHDNTLTQLTKDHTRHQRLLDKGKTLTGNGRKHLTQSVGLEVHALDFEPEYATHPVELGDRFLLCSDGLTDMLDNARITAILKQYQNPRAAVEKLIEEANTDGSRDNITALIVDVEQDTILLNVRKPAKLLAAYQGTTEVEILLEHYATGLEAHAVGDHNAALDALGRVLLDQTTDGFIRGTLLPHIADLYFETLGHVIERYEPTLAEDDTNARHVDKYLQLFRSKDTDTLLENDTIADSLTDFIELMSHKALSLQGTAEQWAAALHVVGPYSRGAYDHLAATAERQRIEEAQRLDLQRLPGDLFREGERQMEVGNYAAACTYFGFVVSIEPNVEAVHELRIVAAREAGLPSFVVQSSLEFLTQRIKFYNYCIQNDRLTTPEVFGGYVQALDRAEAVAYLTHSTPDAVRTSLAELLYESSKYLVDEADSMLRRGDRYSAEQAYRVALAGFEAVSTGYPGKKDSIERVGEKLEAMAQRSAPEQQAAAQKQAPQQQAPPTQQAPEPKTKTIEAVVQDNPKVSVFMTIGPDDRHYAESIASVMQQQYDGGIELCIAADQTKEEELESLKKQYGETMYRVMYVDDTVPNLQSELFTSALGMAQGDYIGHLASGDTLTHRTGWVFKKEHNDSIALMADALDQNSDELYVAAQWDYISVIDGEQHKGPRKKEIDIGRIAQEANRDCTIEEWTRRGGSPALGSFALVKKDTEDHNNVVDYCRAMATLDPIYLAQPLYATRVQKR
jgi:PPM family protein phosphatase